MEEIREDEHDYYCGWGGDRFVFAVDDKGEATITGVFNVYGDQPFSHQHVCRIYPEFRGHPVVAIGDNAFAGCDCMRAVYVHPGLRSIGDRAFEKCDELDCVRFFDDYYNDDGELRCVPMLTVIGEFAFSLCSSLELPNLSLFERLESIGAHAFDGCCSLEACDLPASVRTIGEGAFEDCEALRGIFVPEGVTRIADETFCRCSSLEWVSLPQRLEKIGYGAFMCCDSLRRCQEKEAWLLEDEVIRIPHGVRRIGDDAFACCGNIRVEVPPNVVEIGHGAFDAFFDDYTSGEGSQCAEVISRGDAYVRQWCMENGVMWLDRVTSSQTMRERSGEDWGYTVDFEPEEEEEFLCGITLTEYCGEFESGQVLEVPMYVDGRRVRSLGPEIFRDNARIAGVILPDGLYVIGEAAFCGCLALQRIRMPDSVGSIEPDAFVLCEDVVVECSAGSDAELWCRRNGIAVDTSGRSEIWRTGESGGQKPGT